MAKIKTDKTVTTYWKGKGRKLIVIPKEVLRSRVINNALLNQLHLTDLGFYPAAADHYTLRPDGCPEMIIILCVDGKGTFESPAGHFEVSPGQYFLLPPNQQHRYEADKKDPWSIYWLRIGGTNISRLCMHNSAKKCFRPIYTKEITEISTLFDDLYATLENGYSLQNLIYSNMTLQRILALLLFHVPEDKKGSTVLTNKVIQFMRKQIAVQYSLQELASTFNYSPSQFSHLFKKETGYSPIDYFIHLKIQQGCKLLDLTNMKIYEVASKVGYEDPYHFSKIFKKVMHVSPELYRSVKKG
jgi:AraC family transcriptional regulator of arabinose operon